MTLPLQFAQLQQPQVIQGTGAPDPLNTILAALQQGIGVGARGYEAQQQRQLQQTENDRLARERELDHANATAEGEALRTLILNLAGQERNKVSDAVGQAVGAAQGGMAGTVMLPQVPMQAAGPAGQLGTAVQGAPGEAIPGIVQKARAVLTDQSQYVEKARRLGEIEKAIASVSPDKQKGARAVLTYAEAGANLPTEMQMTLWPELFPQSGESQLDPQQVNAAVNLWAKSGGSMGLGSAYRAAGIKLPPGLPGDLRFIPQVLKFERRPTEQQGKAANFLGQMQTSAPIIDRLVEETGGLSFLGSMAKNQKEGGFKAAALNKLLEGQPKQQQLVAAMQNFGNAWRFAISGQSSSDREFSAILNNATEQYGDAPAVKQQKKNMRMVMIQGIEDLAGGVKTREQVLRDALRLGNWSNEQRAFFQTQLGDAIKYEKDLKAGKVRFDATGPSPGTSDELQQQLDEIRAALSSIPIREP